MQAFSEIYNNAARRKGGDEALAALLPELKNEQELIQTGDDRYLSTLSKCVFQAGFNWKVVENKWSGFEAAFNQFKPEIAASMPDEEIDLLMQDKRVVRNYKKLLSVRNNAIFILDTAVEHDGFGRFIASWPSENMVGLLAYMQKHAHRVGPQTAQYFLRFVGKDMFILSREVVKVLIQNGVVNRTPSSKADLRDVQNAFNTWQLESGRPLAEISKIIACSTD